jgi:hypothetical protein
MSASTIATTVTKLNEHNYRSWVLEMQDVLKQLGLWRLVTGAERVPVAPSTDDDQYVQKYEKFETAHDRYEEKKTKACGTICRALEASIRQRYRDAKFDDPKVLWDTIKADFENVIKLDGKHEQQKLATCKLEDFPSVTEWIAAQDKIISDLAICGITVTDEWRIFYIMSNLPKSADWLGFTTSLNMSDHADTPGKIITQLLAFEATLRRQKGLAPDAALFVTRKQRNQARGGSSDKTWRQNSDSKQRTDKKKKKCDGCGFNGHIKDDCRHPERWEDYAKRQAATRLNSKSSNAPSQAHLAKSTSSSTSEQSDSEPKQSESFLFGVFNASPSESEPSRTQAGTSVYTVDALRASRAAKSNFTSSDWILDTGASSHITGNRHIFSAYRAYAPGEHLVRTANNQVVSAAGVGTVPIRLGRRTFLLRSVLHVPDCGNNNLLSILQLLRKGMKINFDEEKATLTVNCCNVGTAHVRNDLFILRCDDSASIPANPVVFATYAFASISTRPDNKDILLWHARLGHLSLPAIKRASKSTVEGIELHARSPSECICEACIFGKMSRRPFSKDSGERPKTRPLELIHTDVVGPMPTQSRKGYRYLVMFTDDATRYTYIYFLRHKSEVTMFFKQFKAEVEKIHNSSILRIRMDGGGEYSGEEFISFLRQEGIQTEPSTPYTPQQNGTSERCNRTVMEPTRSMLKHAGMPNSFWADAAEVAVYIKNRIPTRALPDTTPFEAWHGTGKKPDLSHLRIFGSLAYAWTSPATRKKLDDRAKKAILIGYTATTQQYLLYDIASRREFLARDIQFNEGCLYSELLGSGTASSSVTFEIPDSANTQAAPALPSVPAATASTTSESEDEASQQLQLEATPQPASVPLPATPPRSTPGGWIDNDTESVLSDCPDPYAEPEPEVPRNLRINMHTSPPKTSTRTRSGRLLLAATTATATAFMVEPGPKTYRAALKTPDAEDWTAAVNTEIAALDSHQAMEFIPEGLSPDATVVNSRWLLSKKFKATGEIEKYKARLIAQGFTQKEGLDFDGNTISSPVVDASTIRFCLGLAAQHNLHIAILDCPTAFLGSTLHETIYLRLPEGNWQDPWNRERPLVRLRKTLYGLKQSARGWFEDVYDFLVDNLHLTASVAAPSLFLGDGIIVLLYVDDIMVMATTVAKLTALCDALHHRFKAAPPKGATIPIADHFQYVGLDIEITRGHSQAGSSVRINQSGYIGKVLEQFSMTNCKPRYTPMEEGLKLGLGRPNTSETGEPPQAEPVDQSLYRQAVGSLLYIALGSRPDIAYAATTLGRYSSNPDQSHWTAVKHLFRYLKATASKKLTITSDSESARVPNSNPIVAFADADLGGEIDTGKSTTGYLVYVLGNLVLWKSKKQTLVAQSTMESELIACAAVKRQIDWFSGLLSELAPSLPLRFASQPLLLNDNLACVTVLNNGNFKGDSRHLRLRFYGLHEAVATEKLLVEHVPSVDMLADGLTKALGRIKHEGFVKDLGLV